MRLDQEATVDVFDGLSKTRGGLTDFDLTSRDALVDLLDQWISSIADLERRGITDLASAIATAGPAGASDWYATQIAGQAALAARSLLRVLDEADAMDKRVKSCEKEAEQHPEDSFYLGVEAGVLFGAADNVRAAVCGKDHPEGMCRHIASLWSA